MKMAKQDTAGFIGRRCIADTLPDWRLAKGFPRWAGFKGPAKPTRSPRLPTPLFPLLLLSPIFRILFQVPYPATPLFGTLTKTAGVCANNSQCGKFPIALERNSQPRLYSSSFFSNSCALFCTEKNSTPSFSSDSALFAQKHRGWRTHLLFNVAKTHRIQGRMMLWP